MHISHHVCLLHFCRFSRLQFYRGGGGILSNLCQVVWPESWTLETSIWKDSKYTTPATLCLEVQRANSLMRDRRRKRTPERNQRPISRYESYRVPHSRCQATYARLVSTLLGIDGHHGPGGNVKMRTRHGCSCTTSLRSPSHNVRYGLLVIYARC